MSTLKPVTIVVRTDDGCTHERTFEPSPLLGPQWAMRSQEEFNCYALGHLFAMLTSGYTNSLDPETWYSDTQATYCGEGTTVVSYELIVR